LDSPALLSWFAWPYRRLRLRAVCLLAQGSLASHATESAEIGDCHRGLVDLQNQGEMVMKKAWGWMAAGAALLLSAGAASSADLAAKPVVKAPPPVEPVYSTWAGFYLGIHGGYGWGDVNGDAIFHADFADFHDPKPRGGLVGGQAGYLWQWGNVVGGLEVDYSAAGLKQDQTFNFSDDVVGTLTSKIDALGSARARLGWLWTPSLLAYGTAGVGWAHSKLTFTQSSPFFQQTSAESSFGWVAGAGLEYQFANNWRLRAEYLHYDFGTVTYFGDESADLRVDVVRGALSFKF